MRRVTESEIQEMRARGFDQATIRDAEEALERSKVADQVIDQIAEAFSGVVLGDGVGLRHAQGLDDYEDEDTCARYREADEKENWQAITPPDLNSCNSSLSFFDPEGMRFHLPAYMTAELRGEYGFGLAFSLTQVGDYGCYYSALDPIQRQAVRRFLLFLLDDPEYEFDRPHIERALEDYWIEVPTQEATEAQQDGGGQPATRTESK
jgi:hypothetical protein